MLFDGLRSCEVLGLNCDDLLLPESQIRVRGKGNKLRWLPLAPETIKLLDHYLHLERPPNCGSPLFVGLKGRARGRRMTSAGVGPLFPPPFPNPPLGRAHPPPRLPTITTAPLPPCPHLATPIQPPCH